MLNKILIIIFALSVSFSVYPQVTSQTQKYRDDEKGDIRYRRQGIMDGNQIRTLFYNNGEVGQWPFQPSGEWPKGTGQTYLDGVAVLIASEVTAPGNGQVIHPLQTSYREWMDKDPVTGVIWGLEPVPGYLNTSYEKPAINTDPRSWPSNWPPALDLTPDWNGYWYGYFGRGVQNSDFETFYVMDDSKDKEYTRAPYQYIPIASDLDRGGLGLRVEIRGFQWSHVLAEDIIFWHYDIVNISDFDYPTTIFGFYTDCGVGGPDDSEDDNASFNTVLDLAYCWDDDGFGVPNRWVTGYYGYAYLESPGNSTNGIDDDEDGMIDESRDNGIDDDGDWVPFSDLNGNGVWDADENEPLNDDLGRDGVGPWDPQYLGPDEGEGDGKPTPGEPNFDQTDKDESDQIGLTAVSIYRLGQGGTGGGWPKDDESMWLKMNYNTFDTSLQRANISMVFASGPFPLLQNKRERFSMALLFGNNLDDLIFNKETVQQIYNANYNFSKPPLKPTLTAVAGDGEVFLYWDKVAEESRDPFLGFQNNDPTQGYKKDFEGYLIYRSNEPEFNDIKVITDSKGDPKYWKPIAQFDLIDSIKGPDPVGINGASFWRGDNTGLQHSYIDRDVKNGQRYYYAVVSYDMGDPSYGTTGLQPSECTKIITEDFSGTLQFVDINCAVITPNSPAAGYVPPQIIGSVNSVKEGNGTGFMNVTVLDPGQIKDGASYSILFESQDIFPRYATTGYNILRTYNGITDTLEKNIDSSSIGLSRTSPPFDGMIVSIHNDTTISLYDSLTGWYQGTSNLRMFPALDTTSRGVLWPANYEIEFTAEASDTTFFDVAPPFTKFPINFKVTDILTGRRVKVAVKDNDNTKSLTYGDEIQILEFIGTPSVSTSRIAWILSYNRPLNPNTQPIDPQPSDKYRIMTKKPYKSGDYFSYSTQASTVNNEDAKNSLNEIGVVPNPYLGAASWERRNLNSTGRGERKIDFINLPAECTVRIFTITGSLIKTLIKTFATADGTLSWNLVTEDGMDAAYGVYVYHIDAPGVGEHIGKFAIIK
jgi:hypothetical protein